jgi:glycosyltransferase involved in cell wall biosynthesis
MISKMRIVHIEAGRHLYGGAVQVRHLVDGLAGAGVDNVLLCARGSELAAAPPAAAVVPLPMHGELDVSLPRRLAAELSRFAPDVVHVHSRRGADLYGGVAASRLGVPAVLTRRVDAAEPAWLARGKYERYDAIVALSRVIEEQLLAAGAPADRIVRIPSAVDLRGFAPRAAARRLLQESFDVPADALVLGVVAQLIPRKRHAWLWALLPELARQYPALHVLCFGRGPLEPELRVQLDGLGLASCVTLAGFRPNLPALMAGLDVLAHPAEREGLGVALLEAAAAGVPVVACAVGGVPDVVVHDRTGMLVPVDEPRAFSAALARLLSAAEERSRLGVAARRLVAERHTVARLVASHLALYERVLDGRAAAARRVVMAP